jgi:flagellar biosynthesis regulator FlaF
MRHAVLSSLAVLKGVKRDEVTHGLAALSYAQKLWNVFRLIVTKAIHAIENIGNNVKEQIIEAVNHEVDIWLRSALLMDVSGSRRQILAETNCES